MAGALTANAVSTGLAPATVDTSPQVVAGVAFLSPVDGANNVLLTAVVSILEGGDDGTATLQWYRANVVDDVDSSVLSTAVGDPFIVDVKALDLPTRFVTVCAIDKGAGATSGYALAVTGAAEAGMYAAGIYVDAVLFD